MLEMKNNGSSVRKHELMSQYARGERPLRDVVEDIERIKPLHKKARFAAFVVLILALILALWLVMQIGVELLLRWID